MPAANLQELIRRNDYPSVSIFMPMHRAHPDTQQDPIRLKNLVNEARRRLDAEVGSRPAAPVIDQLERLSEAVDWRRSKDALGLFASEHYQAVIRLPFSLAERVAVDRTFETREIMAALQRLPRYLVLVLAEEASRLFAGTGDDLEEITDFGFPVSWEGAPGATRGPDAPQMARSGVRDAHLKEFYRTVDAALSDAMVSEPLPLVVLGARPALGAFDEVSRHAERVIARIEGSHAQANAPAIEDLVWPEVRRYLREERAAAVAAVSAARGANLLAAGLDEAWHAAREGRGERLVVEEGYRQPAVVHRDTGAIEFADDATTDGGPRHLDDAVDEVAEVVVGKGGTVFFVDDGELSEYGRIALILRY